jgi:hypothetical protein
LVWAFFGSGLVGLSVCVSRAPPCVSVLGWCACGGAAPAAAINAAAAMAARNLLFMFLRLLTHRNGETPKKTVVRSTGIYAHVT